MRLEHFTNSYRSGSSFTAALLSAPESSMYIFEPIWILNHENIAGWEAKNASLSQGVEKLLKGLFECDRVMS